VIISRTPFRISFFGGGSDYPAWYREHGGAVLATTIDKFCYISCRILPPFFAHRHRIVYSHIENVMHVAEIKHPAVRGVLDHLNCKEGLEIHHDGDLPARSGLGSSSSFTVGLINAYRALKGQRIAKDELAKLAIHVEQEVIRENVGSQDQVSAAFGGFNRIGFHRDGGFDVAPVILPVARLKSLQDHLMLVFTGLPRIASDVAKTKIDNLKNRETEIRRITQMVDEGIAVLASERPIEEFGRLLHEAWIQKRRLSDLVSNKEIDAAYETAQKAGAIGGKILGAGAGGFMVLFARPDRQAEIRAQLGSLVHVPFHFESEGSRIVLYQPEGL
jgi:D-glycero-alpha-D-manno-heptose-7-phosphate kinase